MSRPSRAQWACALAVLLSAAGQAQTADAITVSNDQTRLTVTPQDGQASGFDLIEAASNRVLARVEIAGNRRWAATCETRGQDAAGTLTFSATDTSTVRVTLLESSPFPVIGLRLAGEKGDRLLSCRAAAAQIFYQGGFQTPLPALDPFPAARQKGDHWVSMRACPVPAVGLWSPSTSTFVGYEFQGERPGRHMASACGRPSEGAQGPCFALSMESPAESRFRLIYSTQIPAAASVNEFVLRHIWSTYRDSLPAAPAAVDVGWLPKRDRFVPEDRTSSTLLRRVSKRSLDEQSLLFADGTLLPTGTYRPTLNLVTSGDAERQQRLWDEWRKLEAKAISAHIRDDQCVFWRFPLEGDYEPRFGGAPAATTRSPCNWLVGASLLAMYEGRNDATLLPHIDGLFRWARHCTFTRAGDAASPAAASAPAVAEASVEFFLSFHHLFRNDQDPERRAMAEEALVLGRTMLYRALAIYTGDPDVRGNLDPTFLVQANGDDHSFGTVSWRGTGKVLRAMALYYVETGDPVLGYLLRGALQRWPIGYERDGLHTIESLDVLGMAPNTKRARHGLIPLDGAIAEYCQPVGSAKVRVLCGRKQALVLCVSTAAAIEDYRSQEDASLSFRLTTSASGPIEINVTLPFRNLRGKAVRVNGRPADAEVVGLHGENAVLRGVRDGDVVTVGQISPATPASQPVPARTVRTESRQGEFTLLQLDMTGPSASALSRSWEEGLSWAGLVDGLHYAWGVPFRIIPGENPAVDASKRPVPLPVQDRIGSLFILATRSETPPTVSITYVDGKTERRELREHVPALSSGPMRNWRIDMYPLRLERPDVTVERAEISGNVLLFAATTHATRSSSADAALAQLHAKRMEREAEAQAERERALAQARIVPDSRAKVAAATRGKTLRIAFLPPHESYTNILRAACTTLGSPPVMLSPENVVDADEFNSERYPIAVYSAPETFLHTVKQPGDAARALKTYLRDGGCLVSAARGYPFHYALMSKDGRYEKVKGARNAQTCAELELFIRYPPYPRLEQIPRFELPPGQNVFPHLPKTFRFDAAIGGPYRPAHGGGLPKEDTFTPLMYVSEAAGNAREVVAATIDHQCERYKGGRLIFVWGNILAQEIGPTIALDLMAHTMCTARLGPAPERPPQVAILPRDGAGHEEAIGRACAALGLKTHALTPEEFVDPAVFNPHNFPIAVHAVRGEYFLNRCAGRSDVWQVYVNYVKSGGFLVACGNMFQFYYAGALGPDGKWQQKHDPAQLIPDGVGFRGNYGFNADPGPLFLKCLPGQDIVRFGSPIPLEYLHWGRYRVAQAKDELKVEFVPVAQVTDQRGKPHHGYVIALVRYKSKERADAGVLWFWGDLLDDPRTHPIFNQAIKYAYDQRKAAFEATP